MPGNRGNSWERPATVELIYPDGTPGFEVNAGLRIRGGYSRSPANPKHAFRLFFRGDYGDAKLEYPLFGDEGVDEFDVLDLRTSQNYSWSFEGAVQNTFEREVFGRDLQRDLGLPYTRSRYHHLYINGVYWGLFQTQERVEEHYAESYFGGQKEDYDVIVAGNGYTTETEAGNDVAWRQLFDYAEPLAASPQANANLYWTMQGQNPDGTRNLSLPVLLDVDALINYMLIIFYTGGFDSGLSRFRATTRRTTGSASITATRPTGASSSSFTTMSTRWELAGPATSIARGHSTTAIKTAILHPTRSTCTRI